MASTLILERRQELLMQRGTGGRVGQTQNAEQYIDRRTGGGVVQARGCPSLPGSESRDCL